jgi:hypothetical protein
VTSPRLLAYLGLERARYAARPGRQVVVTSESLRPIMAGRLPGLPCRDFSCHARHHHAQLPVGSGRKREARARLGLPAEGTCLLFVGNDYRKKGLQALLQAMTQLPDDVVLAVVGNPAHIAEFRALAETLKLGARVFFLGALKDVSPAYEAADILVHPTFEDTFAMVVLEAMAHGLPVVVSGPKYCGIAGLLRARRECADAGRPQGCGRTGAGAGGLAGPGRAAGNAVRGRCGLCRALPVAGNRAAAGSAVFFSCRGEGPRVPEDARAAQATSLKCLRLKSSPVSVSTCRMKWYLFSLGVGL